MRLSNSGHHEQARVSLASFNPAQIGQVDLSRKEDDDMRDYSPDDAIAIILDFIMGGRKAPWAKNHRHWGGGQMKFQVGRFICEVLLGEDGKMRVQWLPEPPKYLNKAERDQYQAGVAEFLEGVDQKDRSNITRLNGSG